LAEPGTYKVTLSSRHNGELQALGEAQTFTVKPMRERGLKGANRSEVVAFTRQLDDLNRQSTGAESAIAALLVETGAIKSALLRSSADEALRASARALELEILEMQQSLAGNQRRSLYNHPDRVSINRRLEVATLGTFRSTYGPTATHQQSLQIASEEFASLNRRLAEISRETLPALRLQLDEAGVPWTPGRVLAPVN
jgi:hypothetical protein